MPVKIRLTRHGRKRKPFYHIVIADSRAPRDGRFVEEIGKYNPGTNPATIELDFDKALSWVQKGAQPTDTCRAILSYKGVMYKKHLLEGVKKNAFSEEEAEKRFAEWMSQKEAKIQAKKDGLEQKQTEAQKKRLANETKIREARAAELAKRMSQLAASAAAETAGDAETEDEAAPAVAEAQVEAAENVEEAAEVVAEEAPAEETPAEETPAAEEEKAPEA
jgi:small subunit ribosomal protein S16